MYNYICSLQDLCFYQLRTVEQLGYVVFCYQTSYEGEGSFQVVVQSQEYNATYVLGEIDKFLDNFGSSVIEELNSSKLEDHKSLYANTLKQKPQTLSDEGDEFWGEVSTGRERFDYSHLLLDMLLHVNTTAVKQFYRDHISSPGQYRKLVIGVYGEGKTVDFSQANFKFSLNYDSHNQTATEYPS